jgi:CheY-like chemotaxis protein
MRHVLYVEDNQANRDVMQTFFNMHEHIKLHFAEMIVLKINQDFANQ